MVRSEMCVSYERTLNPQRHSIFRLFDLNQPDLTEVRIQLLLVLLSADGPTFHRLLKLVCTSEAWEHRCVDPLSSPELSC